jgi:hypothetical protein
MPLLPLGDVRELLPQVGEAYGDEQLLVAMGLVAGWLRTATGLTVLPSEIPVDHDLYAPALELLALLVSNPENLERSESGRGVRWRSCGPDTEAGRPGASRPPDAGPTRTGST